MINIAEVKVRESHDFRVKYKDINFISRHSKSIMRYKTYTFHYSCNL